MAGRPKAEKSFAAMLHIAIKETSADGKGTQLRAIAEKLVTEAVSGNMAAIKEVADRLDGKPAQTIEATVEERPSLAAAATAELLERVAGLIERAEGATSGAIEASEGEGDDIGVRPIH